MESITNRILSKVADLHRTYGTCTDVSVFAGMPDAEKNALPVFSDGEIRILQNAVQSGSLQTFSGLPMVRDGRKVLAFAMAAKNAQQVGFSREIQRVSDEMDWANTRFALQYVITDGPEAAKVKLYEFASECIEEQETDRSHTVKAIAKAYSLAKNRTSECLERLWIELFERHGVPGAVVWFRKNWQPCNDETRDAVNDAYKNAKRKYETK